MGFGYQPMRNCKYIMKNGKCNHLERRNIFNRGKKCVLDDTFVTDCTKREGIIRPNRPPPPAGVVGGKSMSYNSTHTVNVTRGGVPPSSMKPPAPAPPPSRQVKFVSTHRLTESDLAGKGE